MSIIIDNPQLLRVVSLFLNEFYGDLTPKTHSDYPDSVFYVDSNNDAIMEYDKKNEYVWISYPILWSRIESLFSLQYDVIQSIMKHWLEETYNLRGVTLFWLRVLPGQLLEETYNLRGVTLTRNSWSNLV